MHVFLLKKKKYYYFCKNHYNNRSIVVKKKKKNIEDASAEDRLNLYGEKRSLIIAGYSRVDLEEVCSTDNGNNAPPPICPDSGIIF